VSRRHAQIEQVNGKYSVRDLGSLNGTYVNQMRIDELALEQGDELQIGKYRMVFFNG
jgi:pSer/pThr/pTyr-binding forkhead associated (FHA) protein